MSKELIERLRGPVPMKEVLGVSTPDLVKIIKERSDAADALSLTGAGEAAAWAYQTATSVDAIGNYCGWEWRISKTHPNMPPGGVRYVQPIRPTVSPATQPGDVPEAPGVKVKGLEWGKEYSERTDGMGYVSVDCSSLVARFRAYRMRFEDATTLEFEHGVLGTFKGLGDAKAAAQANHESRILSALDLTSQDAMAKALSEHQDWVLKYDPLLEYWMVCTELQDRRGYKVLAHNHDPAKAVALAASRHPKEPNP